MAVVMSTGPSTSRAHFTRDFGTVTLTGAGTYEYVTVRYTVKNSSSQTLGVTEERYNPQGGKVTLEGVGLLVEPYYVLPSLGAPLLTGGIAASTSGRDLTLQVDVYAPESTTSLLTLTWTLYYSRVRTNLNLATDVGFLGRHGDRMVSPGQDVRLYFIGHGTETVTVGIQYMEGGVPKTKTCTVNDHTSGMMIGVLLSPDKVAHSAGSGVKATDIVAYSVKMTVGGETVDYANYRVRRQSEQTTHLLFHDCFGNPDSVVLAGRLERSTELDGDYMVSGGQYLKTHTELTEKHTASSGYVYAADREAILDLCESDDVELYDETGMDRVTIVEIDDAAVTPKTEPFALKVTFRRSGETQRRYARTHATEENLRIFDATFDATFE